VLKERIQEVFEFTKSESPYRKANKGWINQDIFLDLSSSADQTKQTNEAAKVTLFWSPIDSLLSNIFLIIILCSILVYTSISFSKGRFNFNLFNKTEIIDIVKVEENKVLGKSELIVIDSTNSTIQQNFDLKDIDETEEINSFDDDSLKEDQKKINQKIDKENSFIKDSQSNKDIQNVQNKKPKSNFI